MKAKITIQVAPTRFEKDEKSPRDTSVYRAKIPLSLRSSPTPGEAFTHVEAIYRWCVEKFGPDVMNSGYSFSSHVRGVTAEFHKDERKMVWINEPTRGCVDIDLLFYNDQFEALFIDTWCNL